MALLEIKNLSIDLQLEEGCRHLVDDLSFEIRRGEALCLIGESGCGKSVTALALTRLLAEDTFVYRGGEIRMAGLDLLGADEPSVRRVRGRKISYIFQDPVAYLNPVIRIGKQIGEMLQLHRPQRFHRDRVIDLLRMVGIPSPELRIDAFPHQLSGGMLQRVMIAMALASEPELLIADEPTTALDVTLQAQILDLLQALREKLGMAVLLITHNLGVVEEFADRVAVMYAGQIVETGSTATVLGNPRHPYTRALIRAVPRLGESNQRLEGIPGQVPLAGDFPTGCRFHPRCPDARPECGSHRPALLSIDSEVEVRCPVLNRS